MVAYILSSLNVEDNQGSQPKEVKRREKWGLIFDTTTSPFIIGMPN